MGKDRSIRVGVLEDTHGSVGGGQLVAAHLAVFLARAYTVDLIHGSQTYTLETLRKTFELDFSAVRERIIPMRGVPMFGLPGSRATMRDVFADSWAVTHPYDLFIYCGPFVPPFCYAKHGLIYCHFPLQSPPLDSVREEVGWKRRHPVDRYFRKRAYELLWRLRMQRYRKVLANSFFTAGWIQQRWGRSAEVIPPPVELSIPAVEKQNIIVSVGRFWGYKRCGKNQLEQVGVFRRLLKEVEGGWKMYLIGSCYTPPHQAYLHAVQKAAEGLPVTFFVNSNREVLCRALGEAKIFWHTAGLSANDREAPEDAEHFGIATVEAMRAGCVPVVIASGGQREIIENGLSGFLCNDLEELMQRTIALSRDENLLTTLSQKAKKSSLIFRGEVFQRSIARIARQYLYRH